jgi:hypothetical protein
MNNTKIGNNCSVKEVIEILEKNGMDSFRVSQSDTFSGSIDKDITLEDLKSENQTVDISDFIENHGSDYPEDYVLESELNVEIDFCEVNDNIEQNNKTKITTGEDLLEYATNNLPDEIPISMKLEYVYLDVTIGDFSERMCFANDSFSEKNKIKTVKKSDVLKSLSSNTEYWTQKIKDSRSLQEVLSHAIKYSCNDYGKDLELSLDSYDFEFDADFQVDNDKYSIGN